MIVLLVFIPSWKNMMILGSPMNLDPVQAKERNTLMVFFMKGKVERMMKNVQIFLIKEKIKPIITLPLIQFLKSQLTVLPMTLQN
jgi:hypothetical protein